MVFGCACLCLCLTFVGAELSFARGSETNPDPDPITIDGTENAQSSDDTQLVENKKTVITMNTPDTFGRHEGERDGFLKRSEIYISPALEDMMKQNDGKDVLFRVAVEILITDEDHQEYTVSNDLDEKLLSLSEKLDIAWKAYVEAEAEYKEEVYQGNLDEAELAELAKEVSKKEDYAQELRQQRNLLREEHLHAYCLSIANKRLEYAEAIGAKIVMPCVDSSDMPCYVAYQGHAYIMELSAEMINDMAAQGGYFFRMASPERKEGYDPKISDYLTTLLDQAADGEVFHVAVVCTADRYNQFASQRGIVVNREYNAALFQPWQIAPYDFENENKYLAWEEYSNLIANYVEDIVERNSLSEKCTFNDKPCIDKYDFLDYRRWQSTGYQNVIAAGFEVKATKAEILSLVEDPDVKLICSMSFYKETSSGIWVNEAASSYR